MNDNKCPICLEPLGESGGKPIGVTTCGHCFHQECYQKWSASKKTSWTDCPTCNCLVEDFIPIYMNFTGDRSESKETEDSNNVSNDDGMDDVIVTLRLLRKCKRELKAKTIENEKLRQEIDAMRGVKEIRESAKHINDKILRRHHHSFRERSSASKF